MKCAKQIKSQSGQAGLDSFFRQAASEKAEEFSATDAKLLIAKAATATIGLGFLGQIVSRLGLKSVMSYLGIVTVSAVFVSLVLGRLADKTDAQISSINKPMNAVAPVKNEEVIENLSALKVESKKSGIIINKETTAHAVIDAKKLQTPNLNNSILSEPENHSVNTDNKSASIEAEKDFALIGNSQQAINNNSRLFASIPSQIENKSLPEPKSESNFRGRNDEFETLFDNFVYKNSYWISCNNQISSANGKPVFITGGKLAWTMNNQLTIGGYGSAMTAKKSMVSSSNAFSNFQAGWGGLFFEYTFNAEKLVHFSVASSFGLGSLIYPDKTQPVSYSQMFYVAEPGANLEVNITKWMKAGAEVSYKFSKSLQPAENTSEADSFIPGKLSAGLFLKFGLF